MTVKPIVLFILKRREDFDPKKHNKHGLSTGLYNSAMFMVDMLNEANIVDARCEVVLDNNHIDRVVTLHNPSYVIIEALWVVPSKFMQLSTLHPNVTWIIRLHSELPFIAGESMAIDWISDYLTQPNVIIGVNAPRMLGDIKSLARAIHPAWSPRRVDATVVYLPNFYPQLYKRKQYQINTGYVNIGCFGAIRPLKNHVLQAMTAVQFAESIDKKLRFHVNVGRVEMKGEPIMANLRALFTHLYDRGHQLVPNVWTPREEFLALCADMDIGLQVSFSETFNIVAADVISQGVPVVGSSEIPWLDDRYTARATYSDEIYKALLATHHDPQGNVSSNQLQLTQYTNSAREAWATYFEGESL